MYDVYKSSNLKQESYRTDRDPLTTLMLEKFTGWAQYSTEEIEVAALLENGILMEFSVKSLDESLNEANLAYYLNSSQ